MEQMISKDKKKYLRSLLHSRNVIIWIGQNGLTGNVMNEIETALNHHELIKIRVRTGESEDRDKLLELICKNSGAEFVQKIGNIISLYRPSRDKPLIVFPK